MSTTRNIFSSEEEINKTHNQISSLEEEQRFLVKKSRKNLGRSLFTICVFGVYLILFWSIIDDYFVVLSLGIVLAILCCFFLRRTYVTESKIRLLYEEAHQQRKKFMRLTNLTFSLKF